MVGIDRAAAIGTAFPFAVRGPALHQSASFFQVGGPAISTLRLVSHGVSQCRLRNDFTHPIDLCSPVPEGAAESMRSRLSAEPNVAQELRESHIRKRLARA